MKFFRMENLLLIVSAIVFSGFSMYFMYNLENPDPIAEAQIIQIKCIDKVTTLVIQEGDRTYHVPAYDSMGEFRCKK